MRASLGKTIIPWEDFLNRHHRPVCPANHLAGTAAFSGDFRLESAKMDAS
jgi:hypothetical protein